ncbi:hypothetical protein [Parafrankia elaeagni]|uniref:hypothetical protein n=1 Tax=Parafrankia elaeagni TaxID=222534 RepID=UPI0003A97AE0|nr:hypothetical protein [Parafrankia elaeagni]
MSAPTGSKLIGRPRFAVAMAFAAGAAGLTGCDQVSEETRAAGGTVLCSQIRVEPSEIQQNPDSARLVALIVRDLAPEQNIKDLAGRVAEDPTALSPRAQLADWVADRCGGTVGGGGAGSGSGSGSGSGAGDGGAGDGGGEDQGAGDDDGGQGDD